MNKRTILACLTAFVLLLSGCGQVLLPPPDSSSSAPATPEVDHEKYRAAYEDNWQFRYLSAEMQARYGAVYTVLSDSFSTDETVTVGTVEQIGVRVPLPTPLTSQEEVTVLYNAFFRDNPQFFYVGSSYGLEGYKQDGNSYFDTLVLGYSMDAATRATARKALTDTATQLVAGCPDNGDDFAVELWLHDRLAERCTYDNGAAAGGFAANPHAFNAYGALVEGKAVCEGYARGMQLLLKTAGIPATLVIGQSVENGEEHMWNLVTVNGQNYHLDPTWDDSDDRLRHSYFNLTTAQLQRTHRIAGGQAGIDTCSALTDNYFVRNGAHIDTYDRDVIARCIATAYLAGNTTVELRFAPDKYDNAVLFLKKHGLTKSTVALYLPEGDAGLWDYKLFGEAEQCVLTLVKDA